MGRFELTAAAAGSKAPWRSTDALPVRVSGRAVEAFSLSDYEKWEIETCLHCTAPECWNCFDAWRNAMGNIRNDTHKSAKKKTKKRRMKARA